MTPAIPDLASQTSLYPSSERPHLEVSGYEAFGTRSRLRVRSGPGEAEVRGQAFWDVEQEVVNYHLVPHHSYDSYVQGDRFRIDTDSDGFPVFLEAQWDSSKHLKVNSLTPPAANAGSVKFLDLRIRFHEQSVLSTRDHAITYIEFCDGECTQYLMVGSGLIFSIGADAYLNSLWIINAIADPNGRAQSKWRADAWRLVRRQKVAEAMTSQGNRMFQSPAPKVY